MKKHGKIWLWFHKWPVRGKGLTLFLEGRAVQVKMVRQFGQWYAIGKDDYGQERAGVGATRTSAALNLLKLLRTVSNYRRRADPDSPPSSSQSPGRTPV